MGSVMVSVEANTNVQDRERAHSDGGGKLQITDAVPVAREPMGMKYL